MRSGRALLWVVFAACVVSAGCARLLNRLKSDAAAPEPATEAECLQFAAELQQAVPAQDKARTADLINLAEPFKRGVADFAGPPEYQARLKKQLEEQAAANPTVPYLLARVREGGQFKLLRVHTVDGRPRALFRLIWPDGAVSHLDFIPARFADGKVRAEDVYQPGTAELLSRTFRTLNLPLAAEDGEGPPGHPPTTDRTWTNHLPKVQAMLRAVADDKGPEAVAIYKGLPAAIRTNRSVFLQYVQAAQLCSDEEYLRALDGFRKQFPGDPATEVHAIDLCRLTRQYAGTVRAIRALEVAIGGDPYLRAMRASELVKGWRFEDARLEAELAVQEEPTLRLAYESRIRVALHQTDHADTLVWLKKLAEGTGQLPGDLRRDPEYDVFVRSPEYRQWLTWTVTRKTE